jgi:hypothetical protein
MGQILGKCKLCLRENAPLQESHSLSSAIYRSMRGNPTGGNPNPYVITHHSAKQTSKQQTAPMLCSDCEQRLSRNGESWVFANGLKADRSFPLKSVLDSRVPDVHEPNHPTKIFYGAGIPEVNVAALTYFAASMFWRFSAHPWKTDGGYSVKLGPFEDQFRQYLLGQASFPGDAVLWVTVRDTSPISHLTYIPTGERIGNMHAHRFPMPGFAFTLYVGKNVPLEYRNLCFVRGPGNPICQSSIIEPHLLREGMTMAQSVADAKMKPASFKFRGSPALASKRMR